MTSHTASTEQDAGAIVADAAARRTPLSLDGGGTQAARPSGADRGDAVDRARSRASRSTSRPSW